MFRACHLVLMIIALLIPALALAADVEARTLKGHHGSVLAVAFLPDGATLASSSRDGTIKLWNVRSGKLERTLAEHAGDVYAVVFSPQGKVLASGCKDKTVKIWDVRTFKVVHTLQGHTDIVRSVAFSPDQRTLEARVAYWIPFTRD